MSGPRDPRISVYPSLTRIDEWTWTITGRTTDGRPFGYRGDTTTEAAAWRSAQNALLVCDPPNTAKAAA